MHGALSKLAPSIVVSFPMSDYFPRRSACGQERPCAGPSPCLLMPERTSRPAQYRRGAGQGLAALRNFNSAYVADGSDYDLAFWALMSALTSCGHSVARTCASVPLHLARFALPEPAVRRDCRSGITPYGSDRSKGPSRASPPARSED